MVDALDKFARRVLVFLAESLELPADVFQPILEAGSMNSGVSTLETIHYFAPARVAVDHAQSSASANCDAHVDRGLLTIIYSDVPSGLQVITPPQQQCSWSQALCGLCILEAALYLRCTSLHSAASFNCISHSSSQSVSINRPAQPFCYEGHVG